MNQSNIIKPLCLILMSILCLTSAHSTAAERTVVRKDIAFIVRTPDRVKHIAERFHVAPRTIIRLNPLMRKRQMLYAGHKISIPVWLERKDPSQPAGEFNIADYTLDMDSLDAYIREDFVCLADIESDTIRKVAIAKDIKRIDKHIAVLGARLDSIEQAGMQTLSKNDIRKMQMARERHTGNFTLASQIDSLNQQKKKLIEESSKIDIRYADYQYLVDNAPYAAKEANNSARVIELQEWGDDPNKPVKNK